MQYKHPKLIYYYEFVFCAIPRVFVYLQMQMSTSNNLHLSEVHCESAVRFGQVLPGYLITAHHLYACVSEVIESLAVWWHNKSKTKYRS